MRSLLLTIGVLAVAVTGLAAEPKYLREVAQWQKVEVPPAADQGARMVWLYAANGSKHEWRVFGERDQICAQLTSEARPPRRDRPKFHPKAGKFRDATALAAVDDGWIVGFNEGEFGAALYWFSRTGKQDYKISDHQIVDFFSLPDGLHAIEGLSHLGLSEGSVIRIARPGPLARWQVETIVKLPAAPQTVAVRRDGTMLITLLDALVSVGKDRKVTMLLPDAPWGIFNPESSVLSPDEQKIFIGMI